MFTLPKSSSDWQTVAVVTVVGLAYFTAGLTGLSLLTDAARPISLSVSGSRVFVAFVTAVLLFGVEQRRTHQSVDVAIADGITLAGIVIVAGSLSGEHEVGLRLALRSGLLLFGLPLLEVITHLLVRRIATKRDGDS